MTMTIRQKLILLLTVALLTLLLVSGFAVIKLGTLSDSLNQSIERHSTALIMVDRARGAQVNFKTQVQEWKNILLRGKDPEAYEKHLRSFSEEARKVTQSLAETKSEAQKLDLAERLKIDDVLLTFSKLEPAYREALSKFDRSQPDPAALVDKAVRGIDRAPSQAIDALVAGIQAGVGEMAAEEKAKTAELNASIHRWMIAFGATATVILILLSLLIIRSINRPLADLSRTMQEIEASGQLANRATITGKDEISAMAQAFNSMLDKFRLVIAEVHRTTEQVSGASDTLAQSASRLSGIASTQASAVAGSAAAVEELTVAICSVADTASEVRSMANTSVNQTVEGNRQVNALVGEIHDIQQNVAEIEQKVAQFIESTQSISNLTREVRDIADQTNLLALNAAIEAARAGEAGRGFAVVADEVRKLAEKSGRSASEIDAVTNTIATQSEAVRASIVAGMQAIDASSAKAVAVEGFLNEARRSVESSSSGVDDIRTSVSEQQQASTEIAQNMERIANMAEETDQSVQMVNQASSELQGLAQNLKQSVSGFRV